MKVWVDEPTISSDRVLFRWRQSELNPFQRANEFFFRYEDIDLSRFSNHLFYEIFLALQLKVFGGYDKPIELIFPEAVSSLSVDYWRTFHRADQVTVRPLSDTRAYEPSVRSSTRPLKHQKAAIFYGGGKDSVLATALLSEIFGADQVVLIQYVAPLKPYPKLAVMLEKRHEEMMLQPIREARGVLTQRVFSDYQANFIEAGYSLRPHLELYTAGALPAMIDRGVEYSSFGSTRLDYPILPLANGKRRYIFSQSRPEVLATQSRHYQRVLGFNHQITNVNFPFTTTMDVHFLHERYPELLNVAVMCTQGNAQQRWCYRCMKCFNWGIYGLACGFVDDRFDFERAFTLTPAAMRMVAYAQSGVERSVHGNVPWTKSVSNHPQSYQALCHAFAKIDPEILSGRISAGAMANLYLMTAMLGNTRFSSHEIVATEIFDFTGVDLMQRVMKLAAEHFPVVKKLPAPWLHGDQEAIIDYETMMPTPLTDLPHLQN